MPFTASVEDSGGNLALYLPVEPTVKAQSIVAALILFKSELPR